MMIANDIYRNRATISEVLNKSKISMRDILTSSQIQQNLKKIGLFVDINYVKSLLKDLGFNWNGPSCSFYDLF